MTRGQLDLAALVGALVARDRKLGALGAAIVVRHLAPDLEKLAPPARAAVEAVESWARGHGSLDAIAAARAGLGAKNRAIDQLCTIASASEPAQLADAVAALTDTVPILLFAQSADGKAWAATLQASQPLLAAVAASPAATRAVEARRSWIAAAIRDVFGDDVTRAEAAIAIAGFAAWCSRFASGDTRPHGQATIEHDRLTEKPPRQSDGDAVLFDAVAAHVRAHVGATDLVVPDTDRRWVHLDVHVVPPTTRRDRVVLVTSGMAERPLFPADGAKQKLFTELVLDLPPAWRYRGDALRDPRGSGRSAGCASSAASRIATASRCGRARPAARSRRRMARARPRSTACCSSPASACRSSRWSGAP